MPTTIREQLLVGIHQTERQLNQIKDAAIRAAFAAELDGYLDEVRNADNVDTEAIRPLHAKLLPLHQRIVEAAK